MKHEKSCGALVFRNTCGYTEMLLLKHRYGNHWSFPKGHVEQGENDTQTALREVKEETGLDIKLVDGFCRSVEYSPKPNTKKQVVFFLGDAGYGTVKKQDEEISKVRWVPFDTAHMYVTFTNDKNLISGAREFLKMKGLYTEGGGA